VPEGEFQPAWRELARPLISAGLLSLLLSVIVAALLSRSIARPLIAMTEASSRIAQGDYQQFIPIRGQDEVARLASAFNLMAQEVERSRQAQRDFLANVSHDLKTPLTSIQGFSQAMLEGAIHDPEGYGRAAQIINEEAGRMGQLIQNLLDLARWDAGEVAEERGPIVPAQLMRHAIEKLAPVAEEAQLELSVCAPDELPILYGDERHLEQALSNFIENAIRYTPAGGQVRITAQLLQAKQGKLLASDGNTGALPELADGHWLAIQVRDTGVGISAEDLPHIFERFYRADKSRGGEHGSGLGLAIAKEIAEADGGVVAVSSTAGSGSCFSLVLPVKDLR
jgi:signal transduction histidine kinase